MAATGTSHACLRLADGTEVVVAETGVTFGRRKHGITDIRVSKQHCTVHFHPATQKVMLTTLSKVNSVYVWRAEGGAAGSRAIRASASPSSSSAACLAVPPGESCVLKDGDKFSLLPKELFVSVSVVTPDLCDESATMMPDTQEVEPMTQLVDAEEFVRFQESVASERDAGRVVGSKCKASPTASSPAKRARKLQRCQTSWLEPQLEIPHTELKFVKKIGQGSCGEVWAADWNGNKVAVKKIFRALLSDSALKEFQSEAKIMKKVRHPNAVQFWGFSQDGETNMLVTEFMNRGALNDVLYDQTVEISEDLLLHIAIGAAKGVDYLHRQNIIHRDLKSMNYLVDDGYQVKVSDFGLSKHVTDGNTGTFCGTLPWTAPEVFKGEAYSTKVDVFSFGIVMWEILTRKEPYKGSATGVIVQGVMAGTLRPSLPAGLSHRLQHYAELMQACWNPDPNKRPTMAQVLQRLNSIAVGDETRMHAEDKAVAGHVAAGGRMESTAIPTHWEIEKKELVFQQKLHGSAASALYSGTFRGRKVRIKAIKHRGAGFEKQFRQVMEVVGSVRDQHISYFFGGLLQPQGGCVVTEYSPLGSLQDLMKSENVVFTMEDVLCLAQEAARALTDLHCWSPPIAHGCLRSSKFLIHEVKEGNIKQMKVTDFCLSRPACAKGQGLELLDRRHVPYIAPEWVVEEHAQGPEADVYSFGIVLWELVTRCATGKYVAPEAAMSEASNKDYLKRVVNDCHRPKLPPGCPIAFEDLLSLLLHPIKHQRPQIATVGQLLQQIRDSGMAGC